MQVTTGAGEVLKRAVDAAEVPGVVALAADETGVIYEGAFGSRESGADRPMTLDTVFWIASMTKAVTSVAAMQLVEQGRLDLDEPLGNLLPALASPQVLEGFDADGMPRLRPATRPITLRLLLTHTAGFAYDTWNDETRLYYKNTGKPGLGSGKREAFRHVPLVFEPGERWEYGISIDWVGLAVEEASGKPLDAYFDEQIFSPLGMNDSGFVLGTSQRERRVSMHRRTGPTSFEVIPFELNQTPEFFMGGGGLYSTGPDYLRFLRMLLHGGELDGARLLQSETVAEMGRNQIGDLSAGVLTSYNPGMSYSAEFFPGIPKRWGLGYMITTQEAPSGRGAGSLAWGGMANTYFWLDPAKRVTGLIMTQLFPFADPVVLDLLARFEAAIYAQRGA
ncbi:MAG TPA: serine hydrolase domain-containing protein [Dehalococcoidia bacterium]|jgi:CubicO group peptidase (beta-lactamase class C family)